MRIGIVIPAHDAAPWIGDALGSVVAQTHAAWSAVVVDDGSTDRTAAIAEHWAADRRITLIRQNRAGVSAARDRGMAACLDAEALLFLDADDWLAPDALARLRHALDTAPNAVAASGPARFVAPDARDSNARPPRRVTRPLPAQGGDILARLLVRNLFANAGHVLIRAEAMRVAGGFRADLSYGEDWEFLTRVAALGAFAAIAGHDPVLFVRRRAAGAYLRMATDPATFVPCMEAIFAAPGLLSRFGAEHLGLLHARAAAETEWVIGRALLAHDPGKARTHLRRSLIARPSPRRLALTVLAHLSQWGLAMGPAPRRSPASAWPPAG